MGHHFPRNNFVNIILLELFATVNFTCQDHQDWGKKFASRTVIKLFYNNQQKVSYDRVRKEQIKEFKQRQRRK